MKISRRRSLAVDSLEPTFQNTIAWTPKHFEPSRFNFTEDTGCSARLGSVGFLTVLGSVLFLFGYNTSAKAADPAVTAICVGEKSTVGQNDPTFRVKGEGVVSNVPNNSSLTITVKFYRVVPNGNDVRMTSKTITTNGVSGSYNYSTSWHDLTGDDYPSVNGTEYYTKVSVLYSANNEFGTIAEVTSAKITLTK
jgi:hypothetical protein